MSARTQPGSVKRDPSVASLEGHIVRVVVADLQASRGLSVSLFLSLSLSLSLPLALSFSLALSCSRSPSLLRLLGLEVNRAWRWKREGIE